jgi:hypothetical protein
MGVPDGQRLTAERFLKMKRNWVNVAFALVAVLSSSVRIVAQNSQGAQPKASPANEPKLLDGWGREVTDPLHGQKPGPAPRHDISGIWEPARGPGDGIMASGVRDMPFDGKPEHDPPYTALGLQTLKAHKPVEGYIKVVTAETNDPRNKCDPMGFPRVDFYQVRHTQILQNERQVVILYQFYKMWRVIWTDGRELPKEIPQPQYFGYSVGRWVDDTTLDVQTTGMEGDPKVWLDSGGRPASDDLRVEEQFHRVDHDNLVLTVTIDDPKMYTKPWVAMKFPMKLQSPDYHVTEMMCIPSEMDQYNKDYGDVASGTDKK